MTVPFDLLSAPVTVHSTTIFVRGLCVEAEIGVYDNERGRKQKLIIDVDMIVRPVKGTQLCDTLDYTLVVDEARSIAASGHIELVETFADVLCRSLLMDERVVSADVSITKPSALAPSTAEAGVRVVMSRAEQP